ncbi:MAG TPA: YggT family protein [Mycobacteriales bacterium]|nr:YggT family protein [Mycobacteriales bacterium]
MSSQSVVGRILSDLVTLYLLVLFARAVIDWVMALSHWRPTGLAIPLFEVIYTVTDPPIKLLRRLIPPLRIGSTALDLGFLVLVLALVIIQQTVLTQI